jgi:hypothetical protein
VRFSPLPRIALIILTIFASLALIAPLYWSKDLDIKMKIIRTGIIKNTKLGLKLGL